MSDIILYLNSTVAVLFGSPALNVSSFSPCFSTFTERGFTLRNHFETNKKVIPYQKVWVSNNLKSVS